MSCFVSETAVVWIDAFQVLQQVLQCFTVAIVLAVQRFLEWWRLRCSSGGASVNAKENTAKVPKVLKSAREG